MVGYLRQEGKNMAVEVESMKEAQHVSLDLEGESAKYSAERGANDLVASKLLQAIKGEDK